MTAQHIPDAETKAALLARIEVTERLVSDLLRAEEEIGRQWDRYQQQRGILLVELRRRVEALRQQVTTGGGGNGA